MLSNIPILSIVAYVPLLGALAIIFFVPREKAQTIKSVATAFAVIDFLLSLPLWIAFDRGREGYQFVERASWIPSLGVEYHFGVDGISLILILLTTLMGVIAIVCSYSAISERLKEYYVLLLLLQTFMIGTFCCLDLFLFYVFWEVMLVPMYFLIGVWGGERRLYAAIKFFLYTLAGSVLMLLGIIALYFLNTTGFLGYHGAGNPATFSIEKLTAVAAGLPVDLQIWLFFAFFLGFAIKVPMFPFHTWLPDAHTEAPTAGSVILAAVLLKMGTYGFVRFSLPMFPEAVKTPWVLKTMIALAIIGIVYGAMVTLVQKDMKRLIAYSSVSHLGFVMLGIFALNMAGIQGSILQMVNHGISTGALFLLVGVVYERRHTRMISEYGGLAKQMPLYATYFLVMALSSMGLPVLNGFIGEFSILQGAFARSFWWAFFAATGIVLGAAYLLWLYQRVFFGELSNPANQKLQDLTLREQLTLAPLVILAFWIGLYPRPIFDLLRVPSERIVTAVGGKTMTAPAYAARVAAAPSAPRTAP
ncbi:MAG TPA: NADH-quinone oxidoreductase subunit M [Thermoanaerobaculia bacterium]|nr:NADH-quinone oxidoreductase subunit M [Thermoanaerobaculia bacterium]